MYGQVLHENRRQIALSSTSSKLPQVGQNRSIVKLIHLKLKYRLVQTNKQNSDEINNTIHVLRMYQMSICHLTLLYAPKVPLYSEQS